MATPIVGLPPGATVEPIAGAAPAQITGLPPGATVEPLGGAPAKPPAAPAAAATAPPPAAAPPAAPPSDPGVLHGLWETTIGPVWDKVKGEHQKQQQREAEPFLTHVEDIFNRAVSENPMLGVPQMKMLHGIISDAYMEGKKSVKAAGKAGKEGLAGVKSAAGGDLSGAVGHLTESQRSASEATGHGLATLLPVLGPMAAKAGEDMGGGKPREGAGEGLGAVLNVLLGSRIGRRAGAGKGAAEVLDESTAARRLTDAINPGAEKMPSMRANLESELPRLRKYAEQAGIELKDRAGLLKTARQAADEYQALYDKQLLEPIKDRLATNGKTFSANEARLRHLNRTTSYQATSAAESEAQLARKAEANHLRDMLNSDMARHLDLTPEQVSQARAAGEKMRAIADTTEYAMDLESHGRNAAERGASANVHVTPHGPYATSGGRVSSKINRGVEKVFGHPGDKAVSEVFSRYNPGEVTAPTPTVLREETPQAQVINRPKPAWQQQPAPGATATIGEMQAARRGLGSKGAKR